MAAIELGGMFADLVHAGHETVGLGKMPIGDRLVQLSLGKGLDLVDAAPVVPIGRVVPIHAGEQRAQRARRNGIDIARNHLAGGAGEIGQRGIAGGIDEGFGADEPIAFHIADHRALDAAARSFCVDNPSKEPHLDAGIQRHLVEQALERLGPERHPAIELAVQEFRDHVGS